jgi:hypothetical protein
MILLQNYGQNTKGKKEFLRLKAQGTGRKELLDNVRLAPYG